MQPIKTRETLMKRTTMTYLRNLAASAAILVIAGGLGVASAQQGGGMGPGGMGGMDHSGMGRGGMGGMDHGAMGHGGGGMEHGGGMGGMMGGGGMEHGGMGGMMGGGGHAMMKKMMCGMTEHVDGRLAYLKAELKITDQQQTAWNSFADAFRAAAQKTGQFCATMTDEHGAGGHEGVIEHLSKMERHMTAHLESVRAVRTALELLFKALTDEQKKTADEFCQAS